LILISCLSPFIADAAPAEGEFWWNFVVDIDAQHSDGHMESGRGLIVGRFDVWLWEHRPKSLLIVTANHLVRSEGGQPATSITVRLPWSATQPRMALLTGLADSVRDVAVLSMPLEPSEEALFGVLIVSGRAELNVDGRVRVGDLTAGALALGGGDNTGSFAGEDDRGNLLVSGLSVIKGQSGSPLIDADGAVVAILTSSEGRPGVSVAVSIERLEKMFPDGHTYLDQRLQPISKADGEARREAYADQGSCKLAHTTCAVTACGKECFPAQDSIDIVMSQQCADCQSQSQSPDCRKARSPRCLQLLAASLDDPWSLRWYLVPTCRCIDSRIVALGRDKTDHYFRCIEPGLIAPLQTELRGDLRELPSRLVKRFPATQPVSASRRYREGIEDAETEVAMDSESLETIAFMSAHTMMVGLPHCLRIPASFRAEATRDLRDSLDDDAVRTNEVKDGITWCTVRVGDGLEKEIVVPLLQLDDKWIYFPGARTSTW